MSSMEGACLTGHLNELNTIMMQLQQSITLVKGNIQSYVHTEISSESYLYA